MFSHFRRAVAAFGLISLGSVIAAAPVNAAGVTGVGSSGGGISLVSVDYGDTLQTTLLGESNADTIDPVAGVPTATETLAPLTVSSVSLPQLDALTVPVVKTTSTGSADEKSTQLLDLSTVGAPGVSGIINPATLKSVVDLDGAQSTLSSTLASLNAIGVVGLESAALNIGGVAGPSSSTANRSVTADAITVLDLQALLNLLGLDISNLSIDELSGLLDALGEVDILNSLLGESFTDAADIQAAVDGLNTAIDAAQTALDTATGLLATAQAAFDLCAPACAQPIIDALNLALANVATAQTTVDALQAQLDDLIQGLLDVLAGTPLLAIDGISAGAIATAQDTLANSSAVVSGAINDLRVGGLDLGGFDANATLDQIEALAAQATSTLNGVLATIHPDLANLLSIALLQRSTSVGQTGEYINALASITALEVTITPPDICTVFQDVLGNTVNIFPQGVELPASPVSDLLVELGSGVPNCLLLVADQVQPQAIGETEIPALTQPLTLTAASVSSNSAFRAVAVPTAPPDEPALPRTGMNETLLLIIGALLAAVALGVRRVTGTARATSRRQ